MTGNTSATPMHAPTTRALPPIFTWWAARTATSAEVIAAIAATTTTRATRRHRAFRVPVSKVLSRSTRA
ncbi:hypothetical protein E2C01_038813 [Portunus trituberculatus]|uniref:Uncharacterized protein n=1 Tax=Portunus trituberculatus TaxID=210409 RepID=A0A5B7FJI8_PORTR|nr:hypothetical protein [Portunus trituberculatus]